MEIYRFYPLFIMFMTFEYGLGGLACGIAACVVAECL